ncbi:MAG: PhzF family phenazine biosynthesis protein [Spirochaetota bacterium]
MIKVFIVDAFTSEMFKGNPAAVCVLSSALPDTLMQSIALEMNCPETAFVLPQDKEFILRWFAPLQEVDLCGHATLATSHVLYEQNIAIAQQELKFHTKSGLLTVNKKGDIITMDFPQEIATKHSIPQWIIETLGVKPVYTGKNRMDYLIEVMTEEEVVELNPDFIALKKMDSRGVIITAKSSKMGYDFVSRFFAPGLGVNEDPVTGSAHCCLGPYWQQKLKKDTFTAYQASQRGGFLKVEVSESRVYIGGKAVTVLSGHINI